MPVSIFQYPLASGCGYPTETLMRIAALPGVVAIKEGSDTMTAYEDNYRRLKSEAPHVAMLPSNFDWFLAQCAVGADGILSGLANLTPHLLVDLWRATKALDLGAMRDAADRLHPIVRTIYGAPPRMDMHTRIKAGLEHLGVIDCAHAPRAPPAHLRRPGRARRTDGGRGRPRPPRFRLRCPGSPPRSRSRPAPWPGGKPSTRRWPRDSPRTVSGIPGAVHQRSESSSATPASSSIATK